MEALTAVLDRVGKRGAPGLRPSPTLPSTGTPRPAGRRGDRSPQTHPGARCRRQGAREGPRLRRRPGQCRNGDLIQQPPLHHPLGQAGHRNPPERLLEVFKDLKINPQP